MPASSCGTSAAASTASGCPTSRVVVCFRFSGVPRAGRGPRVFWLMLEKTAVEICVEDPGVETDLIVDADIAAMTSVWLGDTQLEEALRSNAIRLTGPRKLTTAFPTWLMLSHYAGVVRPSAPNDVPGPAARADRTGQRLQWQGVETVHR